MILFPLSKINLGLNVTNKRSDGYHNIETVFYPVNLSDILEFIEAPDGMIKFECSGIQFSCSEDNLCVKAYNLLKKYYKIPPVHIHLNKIIPIGAGLGGGSSDAAFMMKGLNDYFNLNISDDKLTEMVGTLGSDCPFFIYNKPLFAEGRGEIFTTAGIDLDGLYIVIIYPKIFVSTVSAYNGIVPEQPQISIKDILKKPVENWKDMLKNDFEKTVFNQYPEIENIKDELYQQGALYASMSGSGSSVYGMFGSEPNMSAFEKHSFVWGGTL